MVQGVGFRPFVYQLAQNLDVKGSVVNTTLGVKIHLECTADILDSFSNLLHSNAPQASVIKSVEITEVPVNGYKDFSIAPSVKDCIIKTEISPDIAVCHQCLLDLKSQHHRINYPFINCTHCGPRFSIVTELPYDRESTTMSAFRMCNQCKKEYLDVTNRRFHAQPIACNSCGPTYSLYSQNRTITSVDSILFEISAQIVSGNIVAIKGLGGYHLMCDALNDKAVKRLRDKKGRDGKPFAVLFKNIEKIKEYCIVNHAEEALLSSWRRPILLLQQKKPLVFNVCNGLTTTGAMLPYMPIHHLLFEHLRTDAVVLTSGNFSDSPIIIDDIIAHDQLKPISDCFVSFNREIHNRTDDSVVRVINGLPTLLRRSRGYVPTPVDLMCDVDGILALGAEQKNTICIGSKKQAILSQHIGDIKNASTAEFYKETINRYLKLFKFSPKLIACDLHPNYISTLYAQELSKKLNIPVIQVQHHHAHIVSCMAEHHIDGKVIGVSLDGTGYGNDGNIWGGEFLVCDLEDFTRFTYFDYLPLPGSDRVVDEPWRMLISFMKKYNIREIFELPALTKIDIGKRMLVDEMIEKGINSPLSSSVGRIFDAISVLLGLCTHPTFESEAPMRLESIISNNTSSIDDYYSFGFHQTISIERTLIEILNDTKTLAISIISAKFHNTIAQIIATVSTKIRVEHGINRVVLSGGVFQNKYLAEKTKWLLQNLDFEVYTNSLVPPNDGGISLGQLVIASKKTKSCA